MGAWTDSSGSVQPVGDCSKDSGSSISHTGIMQRLRRLVSAFGPSDEMATMAWAVERIIESPAGQPLNRFEAYQEERRRKEAAD